MANSGRGAWPKKCACGAEHTRDGWRKLAFVGRLPSCGEDALEIRNCVCGSSIAVEIREIEEEERDAEA